MNLFHGSSVEVKSPSIKFARRALDFGRGFYVTSNFAQAEKWSKILQYRKNNTVPAIISTFYFDRDALKNLKVLVFPAANGDWLDFVAANRKGLPLPEKYDIVIGPVANDSTIDVINRYMSGEYTKEVAMLLLRPQNLTDQYTFLTERALEYLKFERSEHV